MKGTEELLEEARAILNCKNEAENKLHDSHLICECLCISAGDIREFIKEKNTTLILDELKKELKLGSGCSSCVKSFAQWKERI